jgi:two-component system phosphate regulon sensor histidine kinase PhoR
MPQDSVETPDTEQRDDRQYTVLVVDDEPGIRSGCRRVLSAEGHSVLLAADAEEGLALLREHDVDLALVDLKMPGMDGMEFLAKAHETEGGDNLVSVMITAYATIEAAVEATKRGAYDFLAKPFAPGELLNVVRRALRHLDLMRERDRLQREREQQLLEVAAEKGRLRTVVEAMADGVLVTNRDGRVVMHNPAALAYLTQPIEAGATPGLDEVIGNETLSQLIGEACNRRECALMTEEVSISAEDASTTALASVAPILDEQGDPLGAVTVLRDITELRRVEEAKAQFVSMVAHELRAPLAAVDGYLAVLDRSIVEDPAKQAEMIGRSRRRLKSLLELVADLLDLSRMESGTVRREIRLVDPREVIEDACQLMLPLAEEHQVSIAGELAEELPAVRVDRDELSRALTNLLSNAVKYNRPQGSVTVAARRDGSYLRVDVADTGVGISPEGQQRLFQEFFREKNDATREITGTGLGLAIVKRIASFYHGKVEFESQLGEGSTFSLLLPVAAGE